MKNDVENTPPDTSIVRAKDLMKWLKIGERTAFRHLKKMKTKYHLENVLYCHFKKHFHIL